MNISRLPLGLFIGFFVSACVGGNPGQQDESAAEVRQMSVASQCGYAAPDLVYIDSRSRLEEVASRRGIRLAALENHNFSDEHLLLVAAGRKPTGGYGLSLETSSLHDGELNISVELAEPGPEQMVTQALTSPCLLLAMPAEGWEVVRVSGRGLPELSVRK